VVKAAVACGHLLFQRHQELQQQSVRPVYIAAPPTAPDRNEHAAGRDVSRLLSDMLDTVCREPRVAAHFTAREMVVGAGGLLDNAFARAEPALVAARDVLHAIVCDAEARGWVVEADRQAKAAEAAKLSRTNFASPPPSLLTLLSSEPSAPPPPSAAWFCSSPLPPAPAAASEPAPGHTLFLLVRTMANLCGCSGGSNATRKAVMQAGAAPFLVAALIPHARARVWGCGGGVLKAQPMVGVDGLAGEWQVGVREEAAGTLSNLALAPQARAALVRACILDVMEDVGYWTCIDGSLLASCSGGSGSISHGARLLHETAAFVERCASVVKSLSQDDACRRRIRSSSRLQELNALAPRQLQDYKFFRARADGRDCVYWGGNRDV
jgi:hypothetical protein